MEMNGVSQKGHLMAESADTAWLHAQENAKMAPGSDISLADTSFPSPVPALGFFFWSLQKAASAASAFPFFAFASSLALGFSASAGLAGPLLSLVAGLATVGAVVVTGESSSLSKVGCKVVGPDLEDEGDDGLLSIGESGEDVSLDGNRLLMLNLPSGDT